MVVKLSDRVEVEWFKQVAPISEVASDEIAVSGLGTIAAASVIADGAPPFIVVSMATDRMEALGLEFMGPQFPAGRQAHPRPSGLPSDTLNVPTFHAPAQSPATATTQLDYAIASRGFHESVKVRAMNSVEEWGASDHCRLLIDISG